MRYVIFLLVVLANAASADPVRILAIGDSILAWHKWTGRDIPSVMGRALDGEVVNDAVAGARFSNRSGVGRAVGFDIRAQYTSGSWDVVVMNGGANDMLSDCKCARCDTVLDELITPNLRGEVPAFITRVLADGGRVIWMGYYASARLGPFDGCRPYLVEYDARIARLAAKTANLTFVDSEDVVDPQNRRHFAFDGIHPSALGARRIGTYLARTVPQ